MPSTPCCEPSHRLSPLCPSTYPHASYHNTRPAPFSHLPSPPLASVQRQPWLVDAMPLPDARLVLRPEGTVADKEVRALDALGRQYAKTVGDELGNGGNFFDADIVAHVHACGSVTANNVQTRLRAGMAYSCLQGPSGQASESHHSTRLPIGHLRENRGGQSRLQDSYGCVALPGTCSIMQLVTPMDHECAPQSTSHSFFPQPPPPALPFLHYTNANMADEQHCT